MVPPICNCQLFRARVTRCRFLRYYVSNLNADKTGFINNGDVAHQGMLPNANISECFDRYTSDKSEDSFISDIDRNVDMEEEQVSENFRKNALNIQMLSRHLYNQLFPSSNEGVDETASKNVKLINAALAELKKHDLPGPLHRIPDVTLDLPEIVNGNIEDHFYAIGESQCARYRELLNTLLGRIPNMPSKWSFTAGWTKYNADGGDPVSVDYPEEDALIFDVEVCCKEGQLPTMATAVSTDAWYSWVSKDLIKGRSHVGERDYYTDSLIPLETASCKISKTKMAATDSCSRKRIVVGHNVSYDRARIKEQYFLERTGVRFMDTMSLHVCINGITSYQKMLLKSSSSSSEDFDNSMLEGSLNGLSDLHKFYCGSHIDKEQRNLFVTGTYGDIIKNFQSLMTYCAKDVRATHDIFARMWPEFLSRFPHPVTLAGMLELSTCYLPVNDKWKRYVEETEQSYNDLNIEGKLLLTQEADYACQLLHEHAFKNDLWLWDLDWNVKELKLKKKKPEPVKRKRSKKKAEIAEEVVEVKQPVIISNSRETTNVINDKRDDDDPDEKFDHCKQMEMEEKFSKLIASVERLPVKQPYLAGYPEWYRKLCSKSNEPDWKHGPHRISTSMQVTPKLLRLTWKSMPLHYMRGFGWGFLLPYGTQIKLTENETSIVPLKALHKHYSKVNGIEFFNEISVAADSRLNDQLERSLMRFIYNGHKNKGKKKTIAEKDNKAEEEDENRNLTMGRKCGFVKLPHKNSDKLNVGNPLAADFIDKFIAESALGGKNSKAAKIIEINRQLSYWKNNRERIESQFIVWLKRKDLPAALKTCSSSYGVILPQVIICGTLTRRAVESTWMTASNATDLRIGSELRSMIQAPNGYSLVGADVDSQELWIASLIGDAYFGREHGCTPFGWMTISGDKSDGTDMHSATAKTMSISRNNAKIINYARIYGAGQYFAERLLKQFLPDITTGQANSRASKMFRKTKGYRVFRLRPHCLPEENRRLYYRNEAKELCTLYNKNVDELFDKPKWDGGSESAMFNRLEEMANVDQPVTPFLRCRLSKLLQPNTKDASDKFLPTRINWVVQSGAVDFLHLMLVCMRWLVDPKVRFILSFHDEVHYMVPQKQKYQTALALHVTNLLTRAFCIRRLGMTDMPQSVAFFSSVEVDTVLRKEASNDCKTPSNPHGLSKGYGVPFGESLNIHEAIKKANGVIGVHTKLTDNAKAENSDNVHS